MILCIKKELDVAFRKTNSKRPPWKRVEIAVENFFGEMYLTYSLNDTYSARGFATSSVLSDMFILWGEFRCSFIEIKSTTKGSITPSLFKGKTNNRKQMLRLKQAKEVGGASVAYVFVDIDESGKFIEAAYIIPFKLVECWVNGSRRNIFKKIKDGDLSRSFSKGSLEVALCVK